LAFKKFPFLDKTAIFKRWAGLLDTIGFFFNKGPIKDHFSQILLKLENWFQSRCQKYVKAYMMNEGPWMTDAK
jgi:hypothetical protein